MSQYSLTWEPLTKLLDEGLEDLLFAHWKEVALDQERIPLAPDWSRALTLEHQKILYTAALRDNGRIVGYNSFLVSPHIHYRHTLHAVNDVVYVAPYARGLAGVRLVKGTEDMLKALGVVKVIYHTKLHLTYKGKTVGDLLEKLGYAPFETLYCKMMEP